MNVETVTNDTSVIGGSNKKFHNYHDLKQYTDASVSKKEILGQLAHWAIRQSPYVVPVNLIGVLWKFSTLLISEPWVQSKYCEDFLKVHSIETLRKSLTETFNKIPQLLDWNERVNGRDGHGFSSRYDAKPDPDDDFIDLDALAGNIAMSVWKDVAEFEEFNAHFDKQYKLMWTDENGTTTCND